MNTVKKQPPEKSRIILSSLKEAVANALEKKRKLGQYGVVWEDNKLVYKGIAIYTSHYSRTGQRSFPRSCVGMHTQA
ncbi:hypothetical protein ABXJ76_05520 [Methylobacter sp. G7]|uniref:hypothetical protein n=1 Tax=Methylobacter sp. G7 TaxID=3230117 RepID=UPI003D809452